MDDQTFLAQYVAELSEWGEQVRQALALRGASTEGVAALLSVIAEHDGAWTKEEVRELQRRADAVYAAALRHYAFEAAEWGKQVEQALALRGAAEDIGLSALSAYIDQHDDAWTEETIAALQQLVDEVYERAVRLIGAPSGEQGQAVGLAAAQTAGVTVAEARTEVDGEREDEQRSTLVDEREEANARAAAAGEQQTGCLDSSLDSLGRERQPAVPPGKHVLPPLPYKYDALEPHISEEIMRLHHTKHHQSYIDGLNQAERMMAEARRTNRFELLKHWEREAAFHGSGHYLHTIFWYNMDPNGGGEPRGELRAQIERDFGSFAAFRRHFTEAAKSAEGVGWALLVWAPRAHRLEILQAEKHQLMAQWDVIPLLVLDVWEHAYYLQYKNDRAAYIANWWNVVNWRNVEARFAEAQKLRWPPF
ncbi:superoxide dismutase [Geobacillus sp. YF-1]|uniref:superoxide dismutase n=1 Tax=Geobacillus sp. YF-1 TaxID=3457480 RepID=UPI0040459640